MERKDKVLLGEMMENLINTPGWNYVKKILEDLIKENKDNVYRMISQSSNVEDLNLIKARVATIEAYDYILSIPEECISFKNREEQEITNGRR